MKGCGCLLEVGGRGPILFEPAPEPFDSAAGSRRLSPGGPQCFVALGRDDGPRIARPDSVLMGERSSPGRLRPTAACGAGSSAGPARAAVHGGLPRGARATSRLNPFAINDDPLGYHDLHESGQAPLVALGLIIKLRVALAKTSRRYLQPLCLML